MKILIAIHGSHSEPERMQALRESWVSDIVGVDYKFFLGQPEGSDSDVVYGDYADGPLWERPGYRSMVGNRKTEALCRYGVENEYDYLFKVDDDTYVRVPELLFSWFDQHDYSGFTESHYTRATGWYRFAQGGAGYWLSRRAMHVIAEKGATLAPAEDFSVGHALALAGIQPYHDDRHNPGPEPKTEDWITLHKVAPDRMREIHQTHYPEREVLRDVTMHAEI